MKWWIMEFTEGVSVQHYYSAAQPSSPISITAVDTTKSFIIPSWGINNTEGSFALVNTGANFSFGSSTSVTLANAGAIMDNVAMQIVQWDGAIAQHMISNINAATPMNVTINEVNLARAIIVSSRNFLSTIEPAQIDQLSRCVLQNSTTVQLSVDMTEYSQDIAITVIMIPQFNVQRGTLTLITTSLTASINTVDTTKTVPWISMSNRPWSQRNEPTTAWLYGTTHATAVTLNSATEVNAARGSAWSDADVDWQVMEFQPPPPRDGVVIFQGPAIF
jgi:surface antigen